MINKAEFADAKFADPMDTFTSLKVPGRKGNLLVQQPVTRKPPIRKDDVAHSETVLIAGKDYAGHIFYEVASYHFRDKLWYSDHGDDYTDRDVLAWWPLPTYQKDRRQEALRQEDEA